MAGKPKTEQHGKAGSTEYKSWEKIKERCLNPKHRSYPRYGGRGITICERWLHSFSAFFQDVGSSPGHSYTLGRKENDGNYEPGNVEWQTRAQQDLCTSRTRLVVWNGETMTVTECARRNNMPTPTLCRRLDSGCSLEYALSAPLQQGKKLIY